MKILIIDDEEMILTLAGKILERSGYEVCLADTGIEGVRLVEQEPATIGVVVIDWLMADYSGLETLSRIREINAGISAVFSSGHNLTKNDIPPSLQENTHFLQKPYRTIELVEMVSKLCPTEKSVG